MAAQPAISHEDEFEQNLTEKNKQMAEIIKVLGPVQHILHRDLSGALGKSFILQARPKLDYEQVDAALDMTLLYVDPQRGQPAQVLGTRAITSDVYNRISSAQDLDALKDEVCQWAQGEINRFNLV